MELFLLLVLFWSAVLYGSRNGWRRWRKWHLQQLARYVSEIRSEDYFRSLSPSQFESLVMRVLKARQFTVLDDPYLGRSSNQGYAWKKGKKIVLVHRTANSMTPKELEGIAKEARMVRAEQALVFYPFPHAPRASNPNVDLLAGERLLKWFSVLDDVAPPVTSRVPDRSCDCGAPLKERVNRQGQFLWVCSRYPDCRMTFEADPAPGHNVIGVS